MHPYDADYFERGEALGISGYTDYRYLPEATIPLAHDLIQSLGIREGDRVLDFGCAKGYLVKALRLLHVDAWGVDVSAYALGEAPADVRSYLSHIATGRALQERYDWIIAKDVLEHMADVRVALQQFRQCSNGLFVAVPLGNGEGRYVIEDYERDRTHVVREPLSWWVAEVEQAGFRIRSASHSMPHVKANWQEQYPTGNGFLVAR